MSRRVHLQQEVVRLDLGEGDWVEVKKRWTVADRQAIDDAMTVVRWDATAKMTSPRKGFRPGKEPANGKEQPQIRFTQQMHLYAATVAALKRGIQAWGGAGFCSIDHETAGTPHIEGTSDCRPIPVSDEAIMALDDDTSSKISELLNELNAVASTEEEEEEDRAEGRTTDPLELNVVSN
jgi:hypothetical protein